MARLIAQLWGTTSLADCLAAVKAMLTPGDLVQGPDILAYEKAFAEKVGVRYAFSFSSGRVALYALLRSFDLPREYEVLLQVPTHIVVPNAIRFAGGSPVYVDCQLDTFNMALDQIKEKVTPRTKVLLIQHTYGIPLDMDAVKRVAEEEGLLVIEDCVHALGAAYHGRPIGSFGHAAFFSTEETKIISSTMGGMAVTDDPEVASRLKAFQEKCAWPDTEIVARYLLKMVIYHLFTHPILHRYTHPIYMYLRRHPRTHLAPGATAESEARGRRPANYLQRLSNGQAQIALRQLNRLEANLAHRRSIARALEEGLAKYHFHLPKHPNGAEPSYVRYPILVSDRPAAMRAASRLVILGQWFDSVLEESVSPAYGGYEMGSCPNAELAAKHLVNLPTHFRIRERDIDPILSLISPFNWQPG
jgi:dTDP-4-amino-4,6-dideoxygalactose transaminase